jgi:AcrR family transcriptional regulator
MRRAAVEQLERIRATLKRVPRPLNDEKRAALLAAAITVIAERGLSAAPTSAISKAAGVAEGTLFTYFPTKHALANALYLDIKLQLASVLFQSAPADASVQQSMRHHWNRFVKWGTDNPQVLRVLDQLTASGIVTAKTAAEGAEPFSELETFIRAAMRSGELRTIPMTYLASTFEALAQNTIRQILAGNGPPAKLRRLGFEMLWRAVGNHP